jgi:hypothetical protein
MLTIEKNVPVHPTTNSTTLELLDTMRKMSIGDSVFVKDGYFESLRRAAKLTGIYVTGRSIYSDAGKRLGIRFWRVSQRTAKSISSERNMRGNFAARRKATKAELTVMPKAA